MNIIRRARGSEIPKRAQRALLCWDRADEALRDRVIADLLSLDAGMECVVSYADNAYSGSESFSAVVEALRNELFGSQALVLCVTADMLKAWKAGLAAGTPPIENARIREAGEPPIGTDRTMQAGAPPIEFVLAMETGTPVLPIAADERLLPAFTELAGALHCIAMSDSEYRAKLKRQLEALLAGDILIREVTEKAFSASIFLSYRRKDLPLARRFMKRFYEADELQSVAVWYDDYLTAGRSFDDEIRDAIRSSDAFVLLATPDLLEPGNYVQTQEYPYAASRSVKIIILEAGRTDIEKNEFMSIFPATEFFASFETESGFFCKLLSDKASFADNNDERSYLLGMAFLKGISVLRDINRAVKLLSAAAAGCSVYSLRASVQLYEIFKFGIILNVDYAQAIKWQRRSVEISEIINGTVHPETAAAYNNLAVLYEEAGDYKQALEWHRKNVAVTENVYGFMSADTAAAYNNIGSLYMRTEEYDNALSMFLKSAASGDDASIYALAMKNTATVFHLTGRYDQALEMYLGALDAFTRLYGAEDPKTALVMNDVGDLYTMTGDFDKAAGMCENAVVILERTSGTGHPDTAVAYHGLAGVYYKMGETGKSLSYLNKAAETLEKLLGREHIDVSTLYNNMGMLYSKAGDYDQALQVTLESLSISEALGIADKSGVIPTLCSLGTIYLKKGSADNALQMYGKALDISRRTQDAYHPAGHMIHNNMGMIYEEMGDDAKAIESYERALDIGRVSLGEDHPDVRATLSNISRLTG